MKKQHKILAALIGLTVLFLSTGVYAADKAIELRLAHMFPIGSPSHQVTEEWAKKIAADSNGKLTIRIFPVNTLVPAPELYDAAAKGTADLCYGFRYLPKGQPLGVTLPFLVSAPDVVVGGKVYDDLWAKFPKEMAAEWNDVKVLWLTASMVQFINTKKPVRKLEDMKGLQIRVPSKEMGGLMKDLGATPVFMSVADMIVGLEKGTVDGATNQPGALHDNKLAGRLNFVLNLSLGTPVPVMSIMNKDTYEKLPADLKAVIDKNNEFGKQKTVQIWIDAYDAAMAYFKAEKVEVVNLPTEEKARWMPIVTQAQDRVGKELDEKGLPGTQVVQYIRERIAFYSK